MSNQRLPDQAARDAIERELGLTLLVEAGAGSGKTESLARRMAAGVVDGRYLVEEMAAVTFTRKAAAELRSRFQLELERRLLEEADAERKTRIDRALATLERLFAGTIHAFCAHLIRERPVEAGVAPGFTEQEDAEDVAFRQRAWREFLDRERATGSPRLRELFETGMTAADLDAAFGTVCTLNDVTFPPGDGEAPDPAPAGRALEMFWRALEPLLPPIAAATSCRVQRAARAFRGRWRVADRSRLSVLAEMLAQWETCTLTQGAWPGTPAQRQATRARVEALLAELRGSANPFLAAWRQYCYRLAITVLTAGRDHAREARRRAVTLNYGDLLEVAARLLREDRTVRAALQQKYRWLFVDEFQDTNALQAEVVVLLASDTETSDDWTRARLRPGALFVVGDPKQSIYRFAGADIETYARVRGIVEASGGRTVELTTSFRALPALCDWANGVFARPEFFSSTPTPAQPAFHSLRAVKTAGPPSSTGLRTLTVGADVRSDRVPLMDAAAIARFIRAEVDAGRRRWRDFLVLTRIRKNLPRYKAALDEPHIPTTVSGAVAFTESREVQLLAGLLRVLADPDDGVALVGVLRGPLFGLTDAELFRHRTSGCGFHLTAPLPDEATGPVVDAMRRLQAMYRWTRSLPAAAAVDRILETTGILARAAAATPGAAEAGDLLHALDRVRRVSEEGGSLAAAADVLARDLTEPDVESIALEPGRQDVVRVMNLHKAKGLEAPVVFLADPVTGGSDRVSVRVVREGRHAYGFFRIVRRNPRRWTGTLLAEPADWGRPRTGRNCVSSGRGHAASLRRSHARSRVARRQSVGGGERRAAVGRLRFTPRPGARAARAGSRARAVSSAGRSGARRLRGVRPRTRFGACCRKPADVARGVRDRHHAQGGSGRPPAPGRPHARARYRRRMGHAGARPARGRHARPPSRPRAPRARRPLADDGQRRAAARGPRGARHRRARHGERVLAARAGGGGAAGGDAVRRARRRPRAVRHDGPRVPRRRGVARDRLQDGSGDGGAARRAVWEAGANVRRPPCAPDRDAGRV